MPQTQLLRKDKKRKINIYKNKTKSMAAEKSIIDRLQYNLSPNKTNQTKKDQTRPKRLIMVNLGQKGQKRPLKTIA